MGRNGTAVVRSVTIDRPAADLYRYWRDLEHVSLIMAPVRSVTPLDHSRARWVMEGPNGTEMEWCTEITQDIENETITWRSVDGSRIDTEAAVTFRPLGPDRGTEVRVTMSVHSAAGAARDAFHALFGDDPEAVVRESLRRFKQIMEAGEVPRIAGQPSGRG